MIYPNREQIVNLNFQIISTTKGLFIPPDNLCNSNSLEWVLNTIQYPLLGSYKTLEEKASLLAWTIIRDHIFNDGNKRTGMVALETFIKMNGQCITATNVEIKDIALFVADSNNKRTSKACLLRWIIEHELQI